MANFVVKCSLVEFCPAQGHLATRIRDQNKNLPSGGKQLNILSHICAIDLDLSLNFVFDT